ncbi:RHS repeat domain-containing protein [Ruminococcus flavefaciens]|uniref:RHS repeat domain-containing protein n=1 Tax=Ruminococcus flavefaciens TaxID=1265 RepID=UPI000AF06793|nr:RHS repeat-associated core domain-containing protein [Ruminococcus flavefaciens]
MIVAEKNIQFNSGTIRSQQNTVIYSKNGNVLINAADVIFNGIIYAPNGTVYINSHNTTVNGKIIAKKIVVSSDKAVVNSTREVEDLFEQLEFLRNDEMLNAVAYYNSENNKITLATNLDDTRLKAGYARYDNGEFVKVTETTENLVRFDVDLFNNTADFMIVITDKFGNEIKSPIHSFSKNENEVTEVVLDTDEDGIPDGYEVLLGTDIEAKDTDKDGFNDDYEIITLGTDPLKFDSDSDFDNDGLTNAEEMAIGSNPFIKDSDFDGIPDKNDASPLEADDAAATSVNEEIPVVIGEFDYVKHYINENGEKCETVYNWLTDSVKKMSVGDKQVIGIFDSEKHCTAMVTDTNDTTVVNTYTYDGDLLSSVTHNGNKYEYTYNNNSDLTDVSINGNVLFHTDFDNNIVAADSAGDVETEYSYDENNNLVGITVDGEEAFAVNYSANGSVDSYEDLVNNVTIRYNYETVDNEVILKSFFSSNGFGYEYNNSENTYETTYSDGDTVKNQSANLNGDLFGSNYSVDISLITGNSNYVTEKTGNENLIKNILVNDENILSANWNINEYGTRDISYQDGKVLDYSYDMNANLALVEENAEVRSSYEYDDFNQLIRENNATAGITYIYDYDNFGNIISVTEYDFTESALGDAVSQTSFGYGDRSWNDLLTEFNGQVITYDGAGNPIEYRDGMTFEWWAQKKIATVTKGDDVISYTYDFDGIRSSKNVNGVETFFNYEDGKLINSKTNDETVWFMYDENASVIGMEIDGEAYYFEKNSQNDVERIFNSTGELICTYGYDAFGNIVSVSGDENIANLNPFRYRSYFYDEETGFYYLNARYYDPVVRRFVNADSVDYLGINGSAISYNLFTYCNNNPVMFEDQNGNVFKYNSSYKVSGSFEKSVSYTPSTWNNNRLYKANCYAYALNMYANGFNNKLQPGQISGTTYDLRPESTWEDSIINALYADLNKMSQQLNYQSGKYLSAWNWWYAGPVYGSGYDIALATGYNSYGYFIDYHWYRKDSNGRWSHKPGYDTVRDYDNSGNKIYNPSTANRGIYNNYVTSFRIYRNSIW